jgi:putative hemolysin
MIPRMFEITLLFGLGFIGLIIFYYAVSLQNMNSAQLDRLLSSKKEPAGRKGLPVTILIMGVRIAALALEMLFFILTALILLTKEMSVLRITVVVVAGFFLVVTGRLFLPASFPLRERDLLSSFERNLIIGCGYLFFPLSYTIDRLSHGAMKSLFPKTEDERITQAEEAIQSIIDAGEEEGIFHQEEGEMLQSIVEFSETIVREVMTPRIDLQAIDITESFESAIRLAVETNYSKIPAFRGGIDNIEGILYSKDLLNFWQTSPESVKLVDIIRPAYFVPETKRVRNLLREFQKEKIHMAIVVDEYGGVAGVATLEDLIEEIFGEIHDEYDVEEETIKSLGENRWAVDGKIDLEELGEVLDIEFPQDNYETLGGFLFDQMGHVPSPGEFHVFQNMKMEISEANERRIMKVIISAIPEHERKREGENSESES